VTFATSAVGHRRLAPASADAGSGTTDSDTAHVDGIAFSERRPAPDFIVANRCFPSTASHRGRSSRRIARRAPLRAASTGASERPSFRHRLGARLAALGCNRPARVGTAGLPTSPGVVGPRQALRRSRASAVDLSARRDCRLDHRVTTAPNGRRAMVLSAPTAGSLRSGTRGSSVRRARCDSSRRLGDGGRRPSVGATGSSRAMVGSSRSRLLRFFGSRDAIRLNQPMWEWTSTPSGKGYWLVAVRRRIFSFGDARFFGSTGCDSAQPGHDRGHWRSTPLGRGYLGSAAAADGSSSSARRDVLAGSDGGASFGLLTGCGIRWSSTAAGTGVRTTAWADLPVFGNRAVLRRHSTGTAPRCSPLAATAAPKLRPPREFAGTVLYLKPAMPSARFSCRAPFPLTAVTTRPWPRRSR
jgi:hypothetical protein